VKKFFVLIIFLQSMVLASSNSKYVCYDNKILISNKYIYNNCSLNEKQCSYYNKKHFGKYKNNKIAYEALKRCKKSNPKFINNGKSISKPTQYDLTLKVGELVSFGSTDAKIITFGGDATPECKLAISLDGQYFFLTKVQSTCKKLINRYGKKIICNSNKSVCKTRDELRDFVMSSINNNSINTNINKPSWCKYAKSYVENKICSNKQLSDLDDKLVEAFNKALITVNNPDKLEEKEKEWVKRRDIECNQKGISCIRNKYIKRIRYLNNLKNKTNNATPKSHSNIKKSNNRSNTNTGKTGTGFFINPKNILTNYHVVKQCNQITVKNIYLDAIVAKVKVIDKPNDLAVLKVDKSVDNYLTFRQNRLEIGEDIITLGYPLGSYLGENAKLTKGIVSSLNGILNDTTKLQFTAPVQHGNSGGPLLDTSGNVVGVIYGGLKNNIAQNVNLAIKNSVAKMLLNSYGINYDEAESNKQLRASQVAKKTKNSIVKVICK